MFYHALYRKYRPKTFNEVCRQEIVIKTLKNSIINNKLSHAYLFIGPRGTGKTSTAKIFAKTINCLNVKDGNSCEECNICKLSNNNENIDIIEMDAASNNGVDEIRNIKNNVNLMPTFSKYKVYIIDEVHMLSIGAFNALLKTLEEPPDHVIFILATTEPQKVPLTIKSRCQSFEFKTIPNKLMKTKLNEICKNEKIKITDDALNQICFDSNGGLRDSINSIDQLNAYTNGNIKLDDVLLLNGRIDNKILNDFINELLNKNISEIYKFSDKFNDEGKDFILICEDLIKELKNILLNMQKDNLNSYKNISNDELIKIIFKINDYINYLRNTNDKKIYFDLLIIEILNIINNDKKDKNIINKKEDIKVISSNNEETKKINKDIEKNKKENNNFSKQMFDNLMHARLNNILRIADKNSLNNYRELLSKINLDNLNLEDRKIFNLISDFSIKAASVDGIVFTSDLINEEDLFNNLDKIEKYLSKIFNNSIKICFYDEENWKKERIIYVKKIKNNENIDIINENEFLIQLNNSKKSNNDFEDLLEIGE